MKAQAAVTPNAQRPPALHSPEESQPGQRSPAVRPQQREQFERALQRQQHEDEPLAPGDAVTLAWREPFSPFTPLELPAQPTPTSSSISPMPALRDTPTVAAPGGAPPRTAAAQDAVSTHLRALGAAPLDATRAHWQLQWAGAATPVQQVDVRRTDSGSLHVDMSGSTFASDPARLAQLRDRVAARLAGGDVVVQAHPARAHGSVGGRVQGRPHPFDHEDSSA